MNEMWFPDPDDGFVEKRYKISTELLARMHRAALEDGLDEESYVLWAIEKSLVRKGCRTEALAGNAGDGSFCFPRSSAVG